MERQVSHSEQAKAEAEIDVDWHGQPAEAGAAYFAGRPGEELSRRQRVTKNDIFDNRLIFGDNLLALKVLEQEFAGKVKCVFIDPPYNTGSAFTHYDDGVEHFIWLSLMRDRLELIRRLLPMVVRCGFPLTITKLTT